MTQDPVYDELVRSIRDHDGAEVQKLLERTKLYTPAIILKALSVVNEEDKKGENVDGIRTAMNEAIFNHPQATTEQKNTTANQELVRLIHEHNGAGVADLLKKHGEYLPPATIVKALSVVAEESKKGENVDAIRMVMNEAIFNHPQATTEQKNTTANQELVRLVHEGNGAGVVDLLKTHNGCLTFNNIQTGLDLAEKEKKAYPMGADKLGPYDSVIKALKNELLDRVEHHKTSAISSHHSEELEYLSSPLKGTKPAAKDNGLA